MNRLAKRDLARGSVIIALGMFLLIVLPVGVIMAWFCVIILSIGVGFTAVALTRRNDSEYDYEHGKKDTPITYYQVDRCGNCGREYADCFCNLNDE